LIYGFLYLNTLFAQDYALRFEKAENFFIYPVFNSVVAYSKNDNMEGWCLPEKGTVNSFSLELFKKLEAPMQRGYIKSFAATEWALNLGVNFLATRSFEINRVKLRLLESYVRFGTKWDYNFYDLGHRKLPYGKQHSLDSGESFLPSLSAFDLGFNRDTGVFLSHRLNQDLQVAFAVTAAKGDTFKWFNGGVFATRLSNLSAYQNEVGLSFLVGALPRLSGAEVLDSSLQKFFRVALDYNYKYREKLLLSQELSFGLSEMASGLKKRSFFTRSSVEFLPDFRIFVPVHLGLSHFFRYEKYRKQSGGEQVAQLFASLGFKITQKMRFRINAVFDYANQNRSREREHAIAFQFCHGCGLKK